MSEGLPCLPLFPLFMKINYYVIWFYSHTVCHILTISGLVVSVVDPQPGETIIDCCAAPGGKTLYMASRLSGQGIN